MVGEMPSASDANTSPTMATEAWAQAKPSTEMVSGQAETPPLR